MQIRRNNREYADETLVHKDLKLNKGTYQVIVKGEEIGFTRQEFKIQELFLSHPNQVFFKQDVYDYAWDDFYTGEDKTIHVHISNIRQKLKQVSEEEYIETVWGVDFKNSRAGQCRKEKGKEFLFRNETAAGDCDGSDWGAGSARVGRTD